jgi:hypothetical protein
MEAFRAEVAQITSMVEAATLPDGIRDTVVWCLGRLPALYDRFCQTYESRYAEEILRLEQGILGKLAEFSPRSADAQEVRNTFLESVRLLNERGGLPGLDVKSPRTPRVRSRNAGLTKAPNRSL